MSGRDIFFIPVALRDFRVLTQAIIEVFSY